MGSPRRRGGGDRFLLKLPGGGVSRRGRGRGAGRVSATNWGILWGGGANFFLFRGETSTKFFIYSSSFFAYS